MPVSIMVGGDIYVPGDNAQCSIAIDGELSALMASVDYRILNLETPLCEGDAGWRIEKTGPHLWSSAQRMLPLMKAMNVDLVSLANNHILDYGYAGLAETLNVLRSNGISWVGAGDGAQAAAVPLFIEHKDCSLAIVNMAENEWASASLDRGGANAYDVLGCAKVIRRARSGSDHVIVIVHGGHENYALPSPRMVNEFRFLVDAGASAVLCHHSHAVSGYEVYKGAPIYYGLGNCLFAYHSDSAEWYTGMLVELRCVRGEAISGLPHFVKLERDFSVLHLLRGAEREVIKKRCLALSASLSNERELEQQFLDYAMSRRAEYLWDLHPLSNWRSTLLFRVLRRLGLVGWRPNRSRAVNLLNRVRCESHAEVLQVALDSVVYERDVRK